MRIIFLNRFYWPEEPATAQLLTDLAGALAARGHEITVIASHPRRTAIPLRESQRGVSILRVTGTRWARLGLAGKAVDFVTFYFLSVVKLAFTAQRGDNVVALTDPPLLGVGAWLVARLCGARVFHWVQDIYPEIAIELSGYSWPRFLRPLRNLAWRRADGCVALGSDMALLLAEAGVRLDRVTLVENWAPAGLELTPRSAADSLRTAWQLDVKFVVAYSGNLGRVHDLDPVLALADALREQAGIAFVFIGHGAQRDRLRAQVTERKLPNVQFHPPQSRERLAATLALGDLQLVTLLPGCERLVFPSKLYGVTAVGRPVLFIGPLDSALARLVESNGFGRSFASDEIAAMAEWISQLRHDRNQLRPLENAAAAFGRDHAGPGRAVQAWEELLNAGD